MNDNIHVGSHIHRSLPPPPEAHEHATAITNSHYKCKNRSSDINTVLSIIQKCDYISTGSGYTGAVHICTRRRDCSLQQKGTKITHHSDEMVEHIHEIPVSVNFVSQAQYKDGEVYRRTDEHGYRHKHRPSLQQWHRDVRRCY